MFYDWPSLPDIVRRVATSVGNKWSRLCPSIADEIWQEVKLAAWQATTKNLPPKMQLSSLVYGDCNRAAWRVMIQWYYWRGMKKGTRVKRKERLSHALDMLQAPKLESDDTNLSYIWNLLTPDQATIMALRFGADLSWREIGKYTGKTKQNACSIYMNGMRRLRKKLLD